jgi:chitinase
MYSTSSKTPEASSTSEYTYYSQSSPIPAVSSKTSAYSAGSSSAYPILSTKTPEASEYEFYSTVTPTVTKPAESTTTVVTTTYLDTCSTGLTTKTTIITKTVCNACAKPTAKPEGDYPEGWTTSVYVSKTLTVTITKPIHPATDVPAYPTDVPEYSAAPKPSAPAAEYPVGKEEVSSYETPAQSTSVYYEATKPSPKPEVPSYPEVPSAEKPTAPAAEYPLASSKPLATLTKVATPVAYTPVAYATPIVHQGYPIGNGTVPSGTGAVKPSVTSTGKPVQPTGYAPPEFQGAASKLGMGVTGVAAVVAFLVL